MLSLIPSPDIPTLCLANSWELQHTAFAWHVYRGSADLVALGDAQRTTRADISLRSHHLVRGNVGNHAQEKPGAFLRAARLRLRRWRKTMVKISSELAQGCRFRATLFRDAEDSIGDVDTSTSKQALRGAGYARRQIDYKTPTSVYGSVLPMAYHEVRWHNYYELLTTL